MTTCRLLFKDNKDYKLPEPELVSLIQDVITDVYIKYPIFKLSTVRLNIHKEICNRLNIPYDNSKSLRIKVEEYMIVELQEMAADNYFTPIDVDDDGNITYRSKRNN